jgi:hypothetical protein
MIVLVVATIMGGLVLRARYQAMAMREKRLRDATPLHLHDDLQRVKERLAVLEQIAIEKDGSLVREIEKLRRS